MEDTIVAISTSVGEGAISIIRLSGHDALNIASKVFTKDLTKVDSHTIHYGFITSNNEKIDEVLVSVMKNPRNVEVFRQLGMDMVINIPEMIADMIG